MNPERSDYLNGDYDTGNRLLRQSYEYFLKVFYKLTGLPSVPGDENVPQPAKNEEGEDYRVTAQPRMRRVALTDDEPLDSKPSAVIEDKVIKKPARGKKTSGAASGLSTDISKTEADELKNEVNWLNSLKNYATNPETYPKPLIFQNDSVFAIRNDYPRAMVHWFIFPRENINSIEDLNSSHLPMLQSMLNLARLIISRYPNPDIVYRVGFLAIPPIK
eukprot:TRINITY_DN1202_c0_g2_i2.p1 TRINITY_DN1202_c0_g2~~TRINITY_DN1202_c0_g2_i2.p1  ORF type:complete len:218 (+),score=31.80 TRINITY_DN1202_c0_g2_i2:106-759(+)